MFFSFEESADQIMRNMEVYRNRFEALGRQGPAAFSIFGSTDDVWLWKCIWSKYTRS